MKYNKLELGCGSSPTPGFLHQDITKQNGINLDYICEPWLIPIKPNTLEKVIAIGVIEHLRFEEVEKTLNHIYNLLQNSGSFIFDVPDMKIWSEYLYNVTHNQTYKNPFTTEHIWKTIYGHQRWVGDEHKSGWTSESIRFLSKRVGYNNIIIDKQVFIDEGIIRNRMNDSRNAHLYIKLIK